MNKKKRAILTILGYLFFMIVGVFISNITLTSMDGIKIVEMYVSESNIIKTLIIQTPPTIFLLYIIKKFYGWKKVGFTKIDKGGLIWFTPYLAVLIFIVYRFVYGIYYSVDSFSTMTWISTVCIFIGAFMSVFSEEIIFRGLLINSFRTKRSIIGAMFLSSITFSIINFSTTSMGIPIINVLSRFIYSSLLGFALVGLFVKINNAWPVIIYHFTLNYILIASNTIGIDLSSIISISNILNLVMAIILWIIVIKDEIHKNSFVYYIEKL